MIILSDLSEVLIHGMYGMEEIVSERHGIRTAEKFIKRKREPEMETEFLNLLRGIITEEAYWKSFLSEDYWPFNFKDAEAMLSENLARPRIRGVLEVYKSIESYPENVGSYSKKRGKPEIWIVSDHIKERLYELHQLHKDVFESVNKEIWSCEVKRIKSDNGFFKMILEQNGLKPDEVVFIDDLGINVSCARGVGITSINFLDHEQLKNELSLLGFGFAVQ